MKTKQGFNTWKFEFHHSTPQKGFSTAAVIVVFVVRWDECSQSAIEKVSNFGRLHDSFDGSLKFASNSHPIINWQLFVCRDREWRDVTVTTSRSMSTEVWCLLFNNEKKLLGAPYKVEVRDISDLTRAIKEVAFSYLANVQAVDLVVWQCKEPRFLSTQPKKLLQWCLSEIDFLNEEKVVELVSGAELRISSLVKRRCCWSKFLVQF